MLPVGTQKEVRNMLLKTGVKMLYSDRKFSRMFSAVLWKAELINNDPEYSNNSKQSVEGATCFFLDACLL